jgi:hypothetical protein
MRSEQVDYITNIAFGYSSVYYYLLRRVKGVAGRERSQENSDETDGNALVKNNRHAII